MNDKQNNDDTFLTRCWHGSILTNEYDVITAFFKSGSISEYRRDIRKMLLATRSHKRYYKNYPDAVLKLSMQLNSFLIATHTISTYRRVNPYIHITKELFQPNQYCIKGNPWDYFPRSLSKREYIQPYLVFKRVFKYKKLNQWQIDLKDIASHSLVKTHQETRFQLLETYLYLTKLVEAAHLINIREIIPNNQQHSKK